MPAVLSLPEDRAPRSPGIHESGVLRGIAYESGILDPKWVDDLSLVDVHQPDWWMSLTSDSKLRILIGLAWEELYAKTLPHVNFHPGELELNGIYLTPDGDALDTIYREDGTGTMGIVGHEFKSTYKSTKTVGDLRDAWLWLTQAKAYCKAMEITVMFIHVLFLCGDYKYPIKPQLKVWRVEFTQGEIDETWDMITGYVQHRQLMEREEAGLEGGN